jgi:hypothetical protein
VIENGVLRRIFGPKREEVTGGWRKLHNEELHNLYSSPRIIRMLRSRRMRWATNCCKIPILIKTSNAELQFVSVMPDDDLVISRNM